MVLEQYMRKALVLAEEALSQGEFPVGSVIVSGDSIVASSHRSGTRSGGVNETDHAEITALKRMDSFGFLERGITIFSTLEPCLMCYGAILIHPVDRIVYAYEDVMGGGTNCPVGSLSPLYAGRSIDIIPGILRKESLDLFKRYFRNRECSYLKNTLLCRYTLEQ